MASGSMTVSGNSAFFTFPSGVSGAIVSRITIYASAGISDSYDYGIEVSGESDAQGAPIISEGIVITGLSKEYNAGDGILVEAYRRSKYGGAVEELNLSSGTILYQIGVSYLKLNGKTLRVVKYVNPVPYSPSLSGTFYIQLPDGEWEAVTLPNQWAPRDATYYTRQLGGELYKR